MPRTLWTAMLSICLWAASSLAGEEGVRWEVQPLLAGKASLTGDGYHVIRSLGTTQTSPDLRLPVQLFYDSASTDLGLLGHGWRIPQLESRAVPMGKNMDWTAPWGETIRFFPKFKPGENTLDVFKEEMKGDGVIILSFSCAP